MVKIMINQSDFDVENNIITCPFSYSCKLPKTHNLCNFPGYKICPDYQVKLQKLNSIFRILD